MDQTFIQWLVGQSGIAGLAGLALVMLKGSYDERLKEEKRNAEVAKGLLAQRDELLNRVLSALEDNTKAISETNSVSREMRLTIERLGWAPRT